MYPTHRPLRLALCAGAMLGLIAVQPALAATQTCIELTDRAFSVRECIELEASPAQATATLPASVLAIAAHELVWNNDLLREISHHATTQGVYTRTAQLDGEATPLRTDRFRTLREGSADHVRFQVELEGHDIERLAIEIVQDLSRTADASGSLVVAYRDGRTKSLPIVDGSVQAAPVSPATKSSFYMGCYIDTPAYDTYRADNCFQLGSSPSTVSFKVFLPYTPDYVVWSQPSSSCSGLWCNAPISPGQTVNGYAYWVIDGTPTGPVSATARYIFEPGF